MNQLGTVVGVGLVGLTFKFYGDTRAGLLAGYGVVAVILSITLLITVVAVKETPITRQRARSERTRIPSAAILCGGAFLAAIIALFTILLAPLGAWLWPAAAVFVASGIVTVLAARRLPALVAFFQAFRSNDFFWTFATRALVTLGIFSILPFLELYFGCFLRKPNTHSRRPF